MKQQTKKIIKSDETIICGLCKLGIDTEKPFSQVTTFECKHKISSIAFYHIDCFRKRLQMPPEVQALASRANKLMTIFEGKL